MYSSHVSTMTRIVLFSCWANIRYSCSTNHCETLACSFGRPLRYLQRFRQVEARHAYHIGLRFVIHHFRDRLFRDNIGPKQCAVCSIGHGGPNNRASCCLSLQRTCFDGEAENEQGITFNLIIIRVNHARGPVVGLLQTTLPPNDTLCNTPATALEFAHPTHLATADSRSHSSRASMPLSFQEKHTQD